ncbi:MAG: hypothetical protein K2X00_10845 [Nitrospiraceae bacterium]|nr:hypothetical protein [Nitrospiraceae bacterium]
MPTDPKFRVIAKRADRPLSEVISVFVMMMTNASANATERGELDNWSDEDAAAALDLQVEHVATIREAMQGKTIDGNKLTGWEKRQPKRDDGSAERAKAWRERNRTQPNAPEKSRGEKIREEIKQSDRPEQVAAREALEPAGRLADDFSACKEAFNGSTDAMLIEVERAMGTHADRASATTWLATTMRINGADATAQAFAMLATAKAENKPIARVLPWWSKTAASIKDRPPKAQTGHPKKPSSGRFTSSQMIARFKEMGHDV